MKKIESKKNKKKISPQIKNKSVSAKPKTVKSEPVLNDRKIPPKKESGVSVFKDSILYASGDLNISSVKNNEFFLAARANIKITGKKTSVEIKGIVRITLPQGENLAENVFFNWLDREIQRDHIFEDREKKWLGKWIKSIESFNNLDDKNIKKIPIDWDFIAKKNGFSVEITDFLKSVHSAGWAKSYENPISINSVKSKKGKYKPGQYKIAVQKNPLPIIVPFYRFLDGEGKRIFDNECIRDLIVAEN